MTIVNTEARLGMTTQRMPRVNLLPAEIAEQATLRKVQVGLGVGLVATVSVVGLLVASASHSKADAQSQLDAAQAKSRQLNSQLATYADVTKTYAAAAAAQAQLTSAMGQEVRYSQLLHDLSLSVPSTVWLKTLTYAQTPPAVAATAPTSTSAAVPTAGTTATTAIGTLTVTGVGFSHDDLALWLESLAGQKNYQNPYFSSSTEVLLGQRKTINFSSTADVTSAAYSGRYNKPVGG